MVAVGFFRGYGVAARGRRLFFWLGSAAAWLSDVVDRVRFGTCEGRGLCGGDSGPPMISSSSDDSTSPRLPESIISTEKYLSASSSLMFLFPPGAWLGGSGYGSGDSELSTTGCSKFEPSKMDLKNLGVLTGLALPGWVDVLLLFGLFPSGKEILLGKTVLLV
jgi:hypothetical protein